MTTEHILNIHDVRRRFDRAALGFDDADFVHSVTRDGLFERLKPVVIDAGVVVDLGCATGSATAKLTKRFRGAKILAVDLSQEMLEQCRAKQGWFSKTSVIQASASALPFDDQSVDIVFANLLLPWISDLPAIAVEVSRVLRKDGLFAFATLGPDSLAELREAWSDDASHAHVNRFLDMHDVGDALVRSGLRDPVLDVDRLNVSYNSARDLFRDLTAVGARNSLQSRNRSLIGKQRFATMRERLEGVDSDDALKLNFELVYGHCWGCGPRNSGGEVRVDANAIPFRSRQ